MNTTTDALHLAWQQACKEIIDRCVAPDMYGNAMAMLDKALSAAALAPARTEQQEPVAWLVYFGNGEKRPVYPAYNTKALAECAAAEIKGSTEVRPLYTVPPAPKAEPAANTVAFDRVIVMTEKDGRLAVSFHGKEGQLRRIVAPSVLEPEDYFCVHGMTGTLPIGKPDLPSEGAG